MVPFRTGTGATQLGLQADVGHIDAVHPYHTQGPWKRGNVYQSGHYLLLKLSFSLQSELCTMAAAIATRFLRPAVFQSGPCLARSSRYSAQSLALGLRTVASSVQDEYMSKTKVRNRACWMSMESTQKLLEIVEEAGRIRRLVRSWMGLLFMILCPLIAYQSRLIV